MRGEAHRAAMRVVFDTFGAEAESFVFVGGCSLAFYARPTGAPLRATTDVDCISTVTPWVRQEQLLGEFCQRGVLAPDPQIQCRYRICGTDVDVDVMSPEGFNVGGVNPWFRRAAERAASYELDPGRWVRAITPPYFLATKLVAFEDRGPDAQSSKDAEDIVTLAIEVPTLVAQVLAEGIDAEVALLWRRVFAKYGLRASDLRDLVDNHVDRRDQEHRERVVLALEQLVKSPSDSPGLT